MKIDLRFNKNINSDLVELFDQVSYSNRENFNDFIDQLSRPLITNIDWWAQTPASRNTYTSPLFHYYCSYKFFLEILQRETIEISEVIVDSKELKQVFQKVLNSKAINNINVIYKPGKTLRWKRLAKKLFYYQYFIIRRYFQSILIRSSDDFDQTRIRSQPITIIDTFLSVDFVNEDRWYGSFWSHVKEQFREEVFFVPTIIDTALREIDYLCTNSKKDGRNIIFKDQYLEIDDFFYAYNHKARIKKLKIGKVFVDDFDFSGLAKEDIENNRDIQTLIEALLTYRFIYKLQKKKIDVRLAIDWFEGHSLDKLWNLAINNYYPKAKRIGYETFRSFPYYLSTFPIPIERDAGTIPDVFAAQGNHCIDCIREFLPDQEVIVIPAFKYDHVWQYDLIALKNSKRVLVTFPISLDSTARILEMLINAYNGDPRLKESGVEFVLKRHPNNSTNEILKKVNIDIPEGFKFTKEKSFPKILKDSIVLITEASSTCLEAMAYGISVIVIENASGLTYDPIPKGTNEKLYRKAKTEDNLIDSLINFLNLDKKNVQLQRELGLEFRKNFFEPVTKEGIYRFLDVGETEQ